MGKIKGEKRAEGKRNGRKKRENNSGFFTEIIHNSGL